MKLKKNVNINVITYETQLKVIIKLGKLLIKSEKQGWKVSTKI